MQKWQTSQERDIYEASDYNWGLALSTEVTWKKRGKYGKKDILTTTTTHFHTQKT
jgi:hypothetical protein